MTKHPDPETRGLSILPYFGGKRTMAPRIVAELGEHTAYFELCCGSMAVLLSKPPSRSETAVDLYGDLVNLARVLKDRQLAPQLYRRLRRTLFCNSIYQEVRRVFKAAGHFRATDKPDLDRAEIFFILSWMGRHGISGKMYFKDSFRRTKKADSANKCAGWKNAVRSIPAFRRRLSDVVIDNVDIFRYADDGGIEDASGVAIYADPPYVDEGNVYVHSFTEADHRRLAAALSRFKRTRVVVSYYDHPLLRELYPPPRWRFIDCTMTKALSNQKLREREDDDGEIVKAPEVLIVNGPSYTESPGLFGAEH
jgi:DNA adenine methylase